MNFKELLAKVTNIGFLIGFLTPDKKDDQLINHYEFNNTPPNIPHNFSKITPILDEENFYLSLENNSEWLYYNNNYFIDLESGYKDIIKMNQTIKV